MIFSLLLNSFESLKRHRNVNTADGIYHEPAASQWNLMSWRTILEYLLRSTLYISYYRHPITLNSISIQSTQQSRDTLKSVFMYKTTRIVFTWDFVYFFSFMLSKSKSKTSFFELRCHFKRFLENFRSEMEFILKQRLKTQIDYECINIKYRWKGWKKEKCSYQAMLLLIFDLFDFGILKLIIILYLAFWVW